LGARRYSFDDNGSKVEGVTLHYLTGDPAADRDQLGEIPLSCSGSPSLFHELQEVPAFYDVDFRQRPGRGGRPTLQVSGVSYAGPAAFGVAADHLEK
jgi:hypothetical protein